MIATRFGGGVHRGSVSTVVEPQLILKKAQEANLSRPRFPSDLRRGLIEACRNDTERVGKLVGALDVSHRLEVEPEDAK